MKLRRWQIGIIVLALLLENPLVAMADPISGTVLTTFLVSLAVSAATTAAQLLLAPLLTPKPKPVDKDKLQGEIKVTAIGEGVPIPEIYGGRQGDNIGGVEHGGIIVYASQIRKEVITIPGGGGGKGAPRAPAQREHHYYQDYAVLVGRGELDVLQIKANTDVIYSGVGNNLPIGTGYEAETATLAGTATATADASCSGGQKVTGVGGTGTITYNNVSAIQGTYELTVFYKTPTAANYPLNVTVNGFTYPSIILYNSNITVGTEVITVELISGVNEIVLSHPSPSADIDRILIGQSVVTCPPNFPICCEDSSSIEPIPCAAFVVSGVKNPTYANPIASYDNLSLVDPLVEDMRGIAEYNYPAKEDSDGLTEIESNLTGASIRIYPGNQTQLPDPMLQAHFNTKYGAGATPAYRGRCLVVIENLEITKYSAIMPNFTFITQNRNVLNLGTMFKDRVKRAGLLDSEIDFTALEGIPIRGVPIMQNQPPRSDIEHLSRIFDVDVYQDADGIIRGVIPTETVSATIPIEELEVQEGWSPSEESNELPAPVVSIIRDEIQLPKRFAVGYTDAGDQFKSKQVLAQREFTVSNRHDAFETGISMTEVEAQAFADRELQKLYAEKDGVKISTFYKYAEVIPTSLIAVEELDGNFTKMRVKAVEGWIPGVLEISGVTRNITEVNPRVETRTNSLQLKVVERMVVPAPVIGTLIDLAMMRTSEYETGMYAAACLTNSSYTWRGGALFVEKAYGWEKIAEFASQSTIGRTIDDTEGALPDQTGAPSLVPEEGTTLIVDLFCGTLDSANSLEIADRKNMCVVGNELCQFESATKQVGYPNRWVLEGFYRLGKGTDGVGHTQAERFVLLDSAVKWIPMDESEIGLTRTYKFVGSNQDINSVSSVDFTYVGNTTQTSSFVATATDDYGINLKDGIVLVDASSKDVKITLPRPTFAENHEPFLIKRVDDSSNTVIVESENSELIDDSSSYGITSQYETLEVFAKNGQWWVK